MGREILFRVVYNKYSFLNIEQATEEQNASKLVQYKIYRYFEWVEEYPHTLGISILKKMSAFFGNTLWGYSYMKVL